MVDDTPEPEPFETPTADVPADEVPALRATRGDEEEDHPAQTQS
jgi:hypothetical protein